MDVTLELNDTIALITLDDGKKNAITLDAIRDINTALDEAEADAAAIVLAGRPGAFSAGFDLATMTGGDMDAIRALGLGGGRIAHRLYGMGKPLLAACTGHAFTIGAFWLLACDTRIGERGKFKFGFNETQMGMVLGPWSIELLKARINPMLYVSTVAQAKIYDPDGAATAGLLDSVVAEGEAIPAAMDAAAQLAQLPGKAYAGNKLGVRQTALEIMATDL
jgi:enoyl-CoA hydratase